MLLQNAGLIFMNPASYRCQALLRRTLVPFFITQQKTATETTSSLFD